MPITAPDAAACEREERGAAICFPRGRKFTNGAAAAGWTISLWCSCSDGHGWVPSSALFANGVSAYGWSIVVLKPRLFVNLLRCLDG